MKKSTNRLRGIWWSTLRIARDSKYWLLHRTLDRYHVIRCDGLGPYYYDTDTRMLHGMFGLLVDYVECESAWMHSIVEKDGPRPHWRYRLPVVRHFFKYRNPEAGLARLKWEAKLEHEGQPTFQSHTAFTALKLYNWWKHERPARPDPMEVSGWNDIYKKAKADEDWWEEPTPDDPHRSRYRYDEEACAAAVRSHEIEEQYHAEDDEMLKELVSIRRGMWT